MTLEWSVVWQHRDALLAATGTTILLTIATMLIAVPCGILVATLRLYAWAPVRTLATAYVELFRNLPLILVVFWAFYVLPILTGLGGLSPLATGLAALALNVTAYNAETFRAGINSIRRGQVEAALALGMSRTQALRRVIVPQAIVRMLPAFGSLLSVTIKDTAIASVIAVPELMRQSETVAGQSFQPIEVYTFAMLVYFLILFPVTRGVDRVYRRVAHLGRS